HQRRRVVRLNRIRQGCVRAFRTDERGSGCRERGAEESSRSGQQRSARHVDGQSEAREPDRFGWFARRIAVSIAPGMSRLDATDWFARRHIGPSPDDRDRMLAAVSAASLDALVDEAIPTSIRLKRPLNLPPAESEYAYLRRLSSIARRNKTFRSYIGLGYHDTITPAVILRMVMENPGWYTPYTPYQAEIAQGRLESLLNFQTMVAELTGMDVAN